MKNKIEEIIVDLGLLIVGFALFIWAEKVTTLASRIIGIIAIAYALILALSIYKGKENKKGEILLSILLFIGGLILVIKPGIIGETISFVVGIFIILTSAKKLRDSIELKKNSKSSLSLYLSIIGIIIGILCVLGKMIIPDIILKFIGLMLVIYSALAILNTIILPKK